MKILQIIYSLSVGGAERFVVDISNELAQQGHDVTLCVLSDDTFGTNGFYKGDIYPNVKFICLQRPIGFKLSNISALFKLIKKINPKIVHCHLNLVNYVFPLTFLFPQIKFFHTIHSVAEKEVSTKLEYYIRRFFYSRFKMRAITISSEVTRSFLNYYRSLPFKEIYNGRTSPQNTEGFSEVKASIQTFRDKGMKIFIHIGRYNIAKNQEMLINVFNMLISTDKKNLLLVIGSGFDTGNALSLRVKANDNIIFLGEKHNVFDYLMHSDAFCLSSLYEGMPISLIEALACGCTPICTPVGGIIDAIEDGKTGYLSKSVSEKDYYNSILNYLKNSDKIKREYLINYYYSRFSIEECVKNHLFVYGN